MKKIIVLILFYVPVLSFSQESKDVCMTYTATFPNTTFGMGFFIELKPKYFVYFDLGFGVKENTKKSDYYYTHNKLVTDYSYSVNVRTGCMCNDGTYSSATGSGACSGHGGVDYWIYEDEYPLKKEIEVTDTVIEHTRTENTFFTLNFGGGYRLLKIRNFELFAMFGIGLTHISSTVYKSYSSDAYILGDLLENRSTKCNLSLNLFAKSNKLAFGIGYDTSLKGLRINLGFNIAYKPLKKEKPVPFIMPPNPLDSLYVNGYYKSDGTYVNGYYRETNR